MGGSTKTYLNLDVAVELGLVGETQHIMVTVLNDITKISEHHQSPLISAAQMVESVSLLMHSLQTM